jgi:hypothetical protein
MSMKRTLLVVLGILVLAVGAFAQSSVASGEIAGVVRDPSDAAIPNTTITVTNTETGAERRIVSGDLGSYRVLLLPPGLYEVKIEAPAFKSQLRKSVRVTVGGTAVVDFKLELGQTTTAIEVVESAPVVDTERIHQANTITEELIRELPIDRRDYLTYTLLAPGVVDSKALADVNDFRSPQVRDTGLSFYGSNGRGNSITIDGGEANDPGGGVRDTLSQEAVQEFQINRSNYSAEFGGASGGIINIVSKSGTNRVRGSAYSFFRHDSLDAADPFAIDLVNDRPVRSDPPSSRQQYGFTLGGPLKLDRTMYFVAFEGMRRRESNAVPVLTDVSIFSPTPAQETILAGLPPASASALRAALTSSPSTQALFRTNSGVFPFSSNEYRTSARIDHQLNVDNQFNFRFNYANSKDTNPNTRALVGVSRGYRTDTLDSGALLTWTHFASSSTVNQARAQFNYRNFLVGTNDPFGPEININGFGYFNRDYALPSETITRYTEFADGLSMIRGSHNFKLGGNVVLRGNHHDVQVFFPGRFTFGTLPGSLVSPALASTSITALQAFNLGLPQFYQQGFGESIVAGTVPLYGLYFQDGWKVASNLTLDLGVRYELDVRSDHIRKDKNNFAPRIGFSWDPMSNGKTVVRGGYGIYFAPSYYQLDYVTKALSDIDGHRQIAQVFTTIQTPGAASAANIYRTLLGQGVIQIPTSTKTITQANIAQFGLAPVQDGPIPPFTTLFFDEEDFVNAYSQQVSFGIDREISNRFSIGASYMFARTLKIIRARDQNLLPAPVDPTLGIRVWTAANFRNPLLLQNNLYESSGRAFYHGLVLETTKRFSANFSGSANYTFSKAIDEVTDYNSDFQANDQTNLNAERSLSAFDQRHKFVAYGTAEYRNFSLSPIFRANSGRPFNLLVGSDLNGDRHSTTDRPPFAGRNTGIGPRFWTMDFRLTRKLFFGDETKLEIIGEAFNVFNRLNYQSVNSTVGMMSGPFNVRGRKDRTPSQPLGFTSAFDPRRIQVGARVSF